MKISPSLFLFLGKIWVMHRYNSGRNRKNLSLYLFVGKTIFYSLKFMKENLCVRVINILSSIYKYIRTVNNMLYFMAGAESEQNLVEAR